MDFYTEVTGDNALDWYDELPKHLRKQVDAELEGYTRANVFEVQKLDPKLSDLTSETIGYKLPAYVAVNHTPDGNTQEEVERFDRRKAWCKLYNDLLLQTVVVDMAPRMQKERKMLSQALGLTQGGNGLPSQAEGLDDTQAATVRWLQTSGETPLEYLTSVYRAQDDSVRVSDKIAAARALLDYVHRKVPAQVEVKGPSTEDVANHAAIVRDIGEQLAKLAQAEKKRSK